MNQTEPQPEPPQLPPIPTTPSSFWDLARQLAAMPAGPQLDAAVADTEARMATWDDEQRRAGTHSWHVLDPESVIFRLVRSANIYRTESGGSCLAKIARSPHAVELRRLNITRSEVMPPGFQALAESVHLNKLTHLSIYDSCMTVAELDLLVNTRYLPALRSLTLGRDFTSTQTALLLRSPLAPRLTELSLTDNRLGDELANQLLSADRLRLTTLDLHGNHISTLARELLAHAPQFAGTRFRYRCASGCRMCWD